MKRSQKFWILASFGTAMFFLATSGSQASSSLASVPEYPGSQKLCDEHVSGEKMHIQWRSMASRDPGNDVMVFFEKKLGTKATPSEHGSMKFVHPNNADLTVTIYPRQSEKYFPGCPRKPDSSAQTVILISQAIR